MLDMLSTGSLSIKTLFATRINLCIYRYILRQGKRWGSVCPDAVGDDSPCTRTQARHCVRSCVCVCVVCASAYVYI